LQKEFDERLKRVWVEASSIRDASLYTRLLLEEHIAKLYPPAGIIYDAYTDGYRDALDDLHERINK